jgi:hypothetical protein
MSVNPVRPLESGLDERGFAPYAGRQMSAINYPTQQEGKSASNSVEVHRHLEKAGFRARG